MTTTAKFEITDIRKPCDNARLEAGTDVMIRKDGKFACVVDGLRGDTPSMHMGHDFYRISIVTPQPAEQPAATESGEKLQIVEGRYYRNRKGGKIGPMLYCPDNVYAKTNPEFVWWYERSYANDGRAWDKAGDPEDLIAPWTESAEKPKANLLVVNEMTNKYRLDRPPTMHTDETYKPALVSEPTPIVDLWQHEREQYRKTIDELGESIKSWRAKHEEVELDNHAIREDHEDLKRANAELVKKVWALDETANLFRAERDELRNEAVSLAQLNSSLKESLESTQEMYVAAQARYEDCEKQLAKERARAARHLHEVNIQGNSLKEISDANIMLCQQVRKHEAEYSAKLRDTIKGMEAELAKVTPAPQPVEEWREPTVFDRGQIVQVSSNKTDWHDHKYIGKIDDHAMPWLVETIGGIPCGYKFARVRNEVTG